AAMLEHTIAATTVTLGLDANAYRNLMAPLVADWDKLAAELLGPFPFPPRHPVTLARFGLSALRSARGLAESRFKGEHARALFAGLAGHSIMPLEQPPTASFGLVLGILGHALGWPLPKGSSQRIADALAAYLRSLGGEIVTNHPVESMDTLPPARVVMFDVTPRQFLRLVGDRLPPGYRGQLEKYRYGPGIFKLDWALDGPIPWQAVECSRAGTVHVGGTLAEIAASEQAMWHGPPAEKPFVLVVQQSLFDSTRAPAGKHTAWAYCHVPHGSTFDMTARIETQIERFAPGFCERILARSVMAPANLEQYNPNYIGGDINGGVQDLWQLFTRPAIRWVPYSTPIKGYYLCSSSTPPGGGVHGMCSYHAAKAALRGV
ncbi:MAG: NAD(P)/FAD-dependent oxidoreductase, partial [Chloroflexi bacterium]|nr:NAD(P)/FAD-dependent oxidoreductase [Chloroflexota bacterium]